MKKIIFLFLMFSAIVFAEWHYGISHNEHGVNFHDFTVYDIKTESELTVGITLDFSRGFSSTVIYNDSVKENDDLLLLIKDNSGDIMEYQIFEKDIEDGWIGIQNSDNYNRGNTLIKILVSAQSVELYNNDTDKTLAFFDFKGLKQIIEKKLGNTYWYKYELNSIYD